MDQEYRSVGLRFMLQTDTEISPSDFVDLLRFAEHFSRRLVEQEALKILHELNVRGQDALAPIQELRRLGRRAPVPAEVLEVNRGSWMVLVGLSAPAVFWVLNHYVHPVVKEAWDESSVRERLKRFTRDRLFGGAADRLENVAVDQPRIGNLQVTEVADDGVDARFAEVIVIRLRRLRVIPAEVDVEQMIKDFADQLEDE